MFGTKCSELIEAILMSLLSKYAGLTRSIETVVGCPLMFKTMVLFWRFRILYGPDYGGCRDDRTGGSSRNTCEQLESSL